MIKMFRSVKEYQFCQRQSHKTNATAVQACVGQQMGKDTSCG